MGEAGPLMLGRLRNHIAYRLANAALRIATPWYRHMIAGSIHYGLRAAAQDAKREKLAEVNRGLQR